jgi:hypothetical protein
MKPASGMHSGHESAPAPARYSSRLPTSSHLTAFLLPRSAIIGDNCFFEKQLRARPPLALPGRSAMEWLHRGWWGWVFVGRLGGGVSDGARSSDPKTTQQGPVSQLELRACSRSESTDVARGREGGWPRT